MPERILLCLLAAFALCQCATPATFPASRIRMDKDTWTSRDGKSLPYTRWPDNPRQPENPRLAIICVHGLSGAASDFWPVGEKFSADGCAIYGMQLRGQGNDPDTASRGDIRSATQWKNDLLDFTAAVRQRHPGVPVIWYGESLGSLIVIHTAAGVHNQRDWVDGIVLSSPVVSFRHQMPWVKYWAIRSVIALRPGKRVSLESLGDSDVKVTNKTTHKQQMEKTPHYVEFFTLRLFRAVEKMVSGANESAARFQVPTLVFYTPNDVFTSKEQIERFFTYIGSAEKTKIYYPDSYHLILHDKDRQNVLRELNHWFARWTKK